MTELNLQVYSDKAKKFSIQYEKMDPEDVHKGWIDFLPENRGAALDVAAGSGRDAAWLESLGFKVYAVEPVESMRKEAKILHPDTAIKWIDDKLPDLKHTLMLSHKFDLILLSAVWMHLTEKEQSEAMQNLSRLAKQEGIVVITIRHGSSPDDRIMYPINTEKVIGYSYDNNFELLDRTGTEDLRERNGVSWESLVLSRGLGQVLNCE